MDENHRGALDRRTLLLSAGALGSTAALTACSAGAQDGTASGGEGTTTVSIGLGAEPANLDFTTTAGAAIPQALLYNVYEGLVKLDEDGEVVGLLASDWTVSEDGLTYDFTLREGVTFHNGDEFTADDVVFSVDRVKNAWTANNPSYMDVVAGVEAVSPTQVRFVLSTVSNGWLFAMCGPVGVVFTPDAVDDLAATAVGTGPYTVAEFVPSQSLTLAANPDYWGEVPAVDSVELRYFEDATTQANALLSGDLDAVYALSSPQLLAQFAGDDAYEVVEGTGTGEVTLAMNNARAPFDDVRVRRAVCHAIDRQAVVDTAYAGYGTLIGSMVPPTDPWYDESLVDLYPYDPDAARALLAEAGATSLTVAFNVPNLPYAVAAAQTVSAQLAQVGITATISTLEFPAVWLQQVFTDHDYDLSIVSHSEPRDIAAFAAPTYYAGNTDTTIVEQFEAADAAPDPDDFVAGMAAGARAMAEQAVAYWLWLQPVLTVVRTGVSGIPPNASSLSLDLSGLQAS